MTLGERLLELIKSRGDRLADASRRTGVAYATLYEIAHDRSKSPSADNLHKIAAAYDVTVGWLLGREGDDIPPTRRLRETVPPYDSAEAEALELFGAFDDVIRHLRGVAPPGQSKARKLAAVEGIERTAQAFGWTLPDWFFDLRRQINDGEL